MKSFIRLDSDKQMNKWMEISIKLAPDGAKNIIVIHYRWQWRGGLRRWRSCSFTASPWRKPINPCREGTARWQTSWKCHNACNWSVVFIHLYSVRIITRPSILPKGQADIVIPWAPDGAIKKENKIFLYSLLMLRITKL